MNISLDALVIAVFVIAVLIGMSRGFALAGRNMLSSIIVIVLMLCLTAPVTTLLSRTPLYTFINDSVIKAVHNTWLDNPAASGMEDTINNMGLPEFITDYLLNNVEHVVSTQESIALSIAEKLSNLILKIISSIGIFVVAKLILSVVFIFISGLLEIPVLEKLDKFMGGLVGAVHALLIVYVICGIILIVTPIDEQQNVNNVIRTTYVMHYFYDNNYLLELFI
ncbi:MAG: CvpA family protein [Oscillospiraceae bacterium]|nr:CvpA family protein [Oscillospiraceae bacterium]